MVNDLAVLLRFCSLLTAQSALQYIPHSPIHTHIHTLMANSAMQGAFCSSGAIWGSASCSRTLRHAWYGISPQKGRKISMSNQVLCFHDCGLELESIVLWLLHGHLTSEWMQIVSIPTEDKSQMGVFCSCEKGIIEEGEYTASRSRAVLAWCPRPADEQQTQQDKTLTCFLPQSWLMMSFQYWEYCLSEAVMIGRPQAAVNRWISQDTFPHTKSHKYIQTHLHLNKRNPRMAFTCLFIV